MKNTTEEKREAIPNSVSRMLLAGIGVRLLHRHSGMHVGTDIFDYAAYIWAAYQLRV